MIWLILAGRARFGWGRAAEAAEETQWAVLSTIAAIGVAEAYLSSEHVGELSLAQLVQSLPG